MVRSTMIFRVTDGLPLAASVDDESVGPRVKVMNLERRVDSTVLFRRQTEKDLVEQKQQSKLLCRRMTDRSEPACSIESGKFTIQ